MKEKEKEDSSQKKTEKKISNPNGYNGKTLADFQPWDFVIYAI